MAETLRLSPVISAYPDDNYENLQIEVILPGVEIGVKRILNAANTPTATKTAIKPTFLYLFTTSWNTKPKSKNGSGYKNPK